jgi:hypothetical protein
MTNPFTAQGNWYRGNLHAHTTGSDGVHKPSEVASLYRESGHDFLCVTDHNAVADVTHLADNDFLTINGVELGYLEYHLLGVGLEKLPEFDTSMSCQDAINLLRDQGAKVIVAHPYWFNQMSKDLLLLEGYLGLEVFCGAAAHVGKGLAAVHWDDLLTHGKSVWGTATDDFHFAKRGDCGQGWIMVKSASLRQEDILTALEQGRFYASTGPEILDFNVEGDEVRIVCSLALSITFMSDRWNGLSLHLEPGQTSMESIHPAREIGRKGWVNRRILLNGKQVIEAVYRLGTRRDLGIERYVRVECSDEFGRKAWTNPLFLGGETDKDTPY